eukprot:10576099-Ditylum_brightwellii.AAC.1
MIKALSSMVSDLQNASPNLSSNTNVTKVATNLTAQKPEKNKHNMNANAVTKSTTSCSTSALSHFHLNSPIIPCNPHDMVSSSPERQKKITVRGADMAAVSLD